MVEFDKKFKSLGCNINKKQIILTHTSREANGYLASLCFRHNGNYDKIPNFLIKKDGTTIKLLDECEYGNFFSDRQVNKNAIVISLENLGWLAHNVKDDIFISWKEEKSETPYFKKWRDYDFWDTYTDAQMDGLVVLCLDLCEKMGISKNFIGHNTIDFGVSGFNGVVNRSNYDKKRTDLNPSFDFNFFKKSLENE